jgi:hypothetical protein
MVGLVFAGASICTPSTCPPGPVSVDFPNSDCTGEPVYQAVTQVSGVCNDGYQMSADEEGIAFLQFYDGNTQCDRERTNTSYYIDIYKFGRCVYNDLRRGEKSGLNLGPRMERSSMSASFMYLANVNDTTTPSNFDNQWLQAYQNNGEGCYSFGNCTKSDGSTPLVYDDYYSNPGCVNPQDSSYNSHEALDVCLNYYNVSYVKMGCFDDHGSYFAHFSDAECKIPDAIYAHRSVCETSQVTIHCNAPITQFPGTSAGPQAPTSSASSIQSSILMLAVVLIAMITLF